MSTEMENAVQNRPVFATDRPGAGHSLRTSTKDIRPEHESLWNVAQDLEATFIAEMLKHSGLGPSDGPFSGGAGEEQFASFLTQEHARLFTERGGIGLAESIFRALTTRAGEP